MAGTPRLVDARVTGCYISILRPLAPVIYVFRLTTASRETHRAPPKHALKRYSRRRELHESKRRDPRQYLRGEPRVQFHLNRRFLRRKLLSEAAGERPLPDWNVAHGVKKNGPKEMWRIGFIRR